MYGLFEGGPTQYLFEGRTDAGVTIADLTVCGERPDRDVIVTFLADGDRRRAERVLERWGRLAGYHRIWFPSRVVTLDDGSATVLPRMSTECRACGATWSDHDQRFWTKVGDAGVFPTWCPLCGCDMPQWEVRTRRRAVPTRASGRRKARERRP